MNHTRRKVFLSRTSVNGSIAVLVVFGCSFVIYQCSTIPRGLGASVSRWPRLDVGNPDHPKDIKMKDFATQIYGAVKDRKLKEPFGPDDVERACPGWAPRTYTNFCLSMQWGIRAKQPNYFKGSGRADIALKSLPKDISPADFEKYVDEADAWLHDANGWILKNLGADLGQGRKSTAQ
jgi:hypothetical protein